jgi:hypothetical protein
MRRAVRRLLTLLMLTHEWFDTHCAATRSLVKLTFSMCAFFFFFFFWCGRGQVNVRVDGMLRGAWGHRPLDVEMVACVCDGTAMLTSRSLTLALPPFKGLCPVSHHTLLCRARDFSDSFLTTTVAASKCTSTSAVSCPTSHLRARGELLRSALGLFLSPVRW